MTWDQLFQVIQLYGPDLIKLVKSARDIHGADGIASFEQIEAERAKLQSPLTEVPDKP
jgi:hypothetical protein